MTTDTRYPAWTADGTRPWHHRTHDRDIGGRTVRVWLGSYDKWRMRVANNSPVEYMLSDECAALERCIGWWEKTRGQKVSDWHPGDCAFNGWIGIAYLPADPRPATAAWPRWKHLAHTDVRRKNHWTDLLPEYERIIALPDEELVALLGE